VLNKNWKICRIWCNRYNWTGQIFSYLSKASFTKGSTVVEFQQNEDGKYFIGHPSFLLAKFYRLIPQNETEFLVYNQSYQTTTALVFNKYRQKYI